MGMVGPGNGTVFTIGHSNHTLQHFLKLLESHAITAVADVRSSPFSGYNPQFNREALAASLKQSGISYVFVGAELGARPADIGCYTGDKVDFERLMASAGFKAGIERLLGGARDHHVALMCAEKDPLKCHRGILISRALEARGLAVQHILADGGVETNAAAMSRLLDVVGLPQEDMFRSRDELIDEACALQEREIAFSESGRSL